MKKMMRQDLILKHLSYVKGIAYNICWRKNCLHTLLADCQSVGIEALIQAIDSYDESHLSSLKTWIVIKVRFAVLDFIQKEKGTWSRAVPIMVDIKECANSLDLSTDGTEQMVCNKDMIHQALNYVRKTPVKRRREKEIEDLLAYLADGYLMREIAEWRGCSTANVSMMISGLRKRIKKFEKELMI